jgi:hypothetical protein
MQKHIEYVTNFINRRLTYGLIMLAAVSSGAGLTALASETGVNFPVALASPLLVYGVIYLVWDNWVWRVASRFGYPLPDLNGTWTGDYCLTTEPDVKLPCSMQIRQTWAHMEVYFTSEVGFSRSTLLSLNDSSGSPSGLCHIYKMRPKTEKPDDKRETAEVPGHEGVAQLWPQGGEWDNVQGRFYGDLESKARGSISMHRSSRNVPPRSAARVEAMSRRPTSP